MAEEEKKEQNQRTCLGFLFIFEWVGIAIKVIVQQKCSKREYLLPSFSEIIFTPVPCGFFFS